MATLIPREGEEIWQTTTNSVLWLQVTGARGEVRDKDFGGKVGSTVRIKTTDRELIQENIYEVERDPFRNGMLKRIDSDQNEDEQTATDQALDTQQLLKVFSKSGNAFQSMVDKMNEVNVRRMKDMADAVDATQSQVAYIEEVIEAKFRKHGETRTYREMVALDRSTQV